MDGYQLSWPMKRGRLNLHDKAGGSMASVLADLETIWSSVIYSQLQIPTKDLKVGSMGCLYLKVGSMLVPQCGQYDCTSRCDVLVPQGG